MGYASRATSTCGPLRAPDCPCLGAWPALDAGCARRRADPDAPAPGWSPAVPDGTGWRGDTSPLKGDRNRDEGLDAHEPSRAGDAQAPELVWRGGGRPLVAGGCGAAVMARGARSASTGGPASKVDHQSAAQRFTYVRRL